MFLPSKPSIVLLLFTFLCSFPASPLHATSEPSPSLPSAIRNLRWLFFVNYPLHMHAFQSFSSFKSLPKMHHFRIAFGSLDLNWIWTWPEHVPVRLDSKYSPHFTFFCTTFCTLCCFSCWFFDQCLWRLDCKVFKAGSWPVFYTS